MTTNPDHDKDQQELRARAFQAAKTALEYRRFTEAKQDEAPAEGKIYFFPGLKDTIDGDDLPVYWVITHRDPERDDWWFAAPADDFPLVGLCDLEISPQHPLAPLTIRLNAHTLFPNSLFEDARFVGEMGKDDLQSVYDRYQSMIFATLPATTNRLHAEKNTEYRNWMLQVGAACRQLHARCEEAAPSPQIGATKEPGHTAPAARSAKARTAAPASPNRWTRTIIAVGSIAAAACVLIAIYLVNIRNGGDGSDVNRPIAHDPPPDGGSSPGVNSPITDDPPPPRPGTETNPPPSVIASVPRLGKLNELLDRRGAPKSETLGDSNKVFANHPYRITTKQPSSLKHQWLLLINNSVQLVACGPGDEILDERVTIPPHDEDFDLFAVVEANQPTRQLPALCPSTPRKITIQTKELSEQQCLEQLQQLPDFAGEEEKFDKARWELLQRMLKETEFSDQPFTFTLYVAEHS